MEKRFCKCGCGGEVKTWKNGIESPFLRGHHMRKKGYRPLIEGPHYCSCGCGQEIDPHPANGYVRKYIKGHHLKGKRLDLQYRIERARSRWGVEPILSPFLKETFVKFDKKMKRWTACIKLENGKNKPCMHAYAVYREHYGEIPKGLVVHHKNGKHSKIEDDRPENLMLLPDEWNLRFFPVLSKGFGVPESVVTEIYIGIYDDKKTKEELFYDLCRGIQSHVDLVG